MKLRSLGGCFTTIIVAIVAIGVVEWAFNHFNGTAGCKPHFSKFSCWYLDEAQYDVYYWANLDDDNEEDNKLIASATGLRECRAKAIEYAARIGEPWFWRAYICVLIKDGVATEKHRYEDGVST